MSRLDKLLDDFDWAFMQSFMEPILAKYDRTAVINLAIDTTRPPKYSLKRGILECLD